MIKMLLIFIIIYDINFIQLGSITSARVGLVMILFLALYYKTKLDKRTFYFLVLLFLLIFASFVQYLFSNDFIQTSRLIFFTLYSVVCSLVLCKLIRNLEELFWLFLVAIALQSFVLLFSFFNPSFKTFLATLVVYGGQLNADVNIYRAFGLSSSTGATISLIQAIGVLCGFILINKFQNSFYKNLLISLLIFVCLLSTIVTGRTGLIISLACIVLTAVSLTFIKKTILLVCLILLLSIDFSFILEDFLIEVPKFNIEYFSEWVSQGFDYEDNVTVSILESMPVPDLTFQTIIGTGKVFNEFEGKNASNNDSGYIQTYYALGLILALVFYISLVIYMISGLLFNWKNERWIVYLIILMLILDFKEPFIFKYSFPLFIMLIINISRKDQIYNTLSINDKI